MTGSTPDRAARMFPALLAVATAVGLLLRAWGLASQPPLPDDFGCGASAVNFVERAQIGPVEWQHPHLRDLLVYGGMEVAGPTKLGFALVSLTLGVLSVPVVGLLGRALGGPAVGLLAAALLAIDPVHVGYSRQAVQEGYPLFFGALGTLFTIRYDRSGLPYRLVAAGAAYGLGVASKWSVIFPAIAALAWTIGREVRRADGRRDAMWRVALAMVWLVIVPASVYLVTWTPWLLGGRDLVDLARLHVTMAGEAVTHGGYNPADLALAHRPALWFVEPTAYASFTMGSRGPVAFVFLTNPLVWLLVLPAAAVAAREAWRRRNADDVLLVALFAAAYVPFVFARRPIWVHSALAVLPFAIVLVAALVVRTGERLSRPRAIAISYLALTALVSAPLYALATGAGLDSSLLRSIAERYRPAFELERGPGSP